ncbi:DUF4376 domain-containing protein [Halomonas sp. DP8Y7-3]|uniref:DUF4376 domain-containing protein n=1 Tax=Halomonas sp. DP8Y7-3 TaxID=2859079 RepID=UPI001C970495|nr:DUF4376 domain-containing protein [Halomonas sp. DP8Y7-3]MBY5930790.1 DUF4376 domain-containing protein [Halomonas sp. DP8Y7-3]
MIFSPSAERFFAPEWREHYLAAGTWPSDGIELSPDDAEPYQGQPPSGKRLAAGTDGKPCWVDADPEPLETLATRQRAAIATALAEALAAGMPYTMPDGTDETVQMLAEDRQNLLGLAIEARDLKAAGETGAVQEFRGLSNTRYPMTPDETIALTDAALAHYKALKAQSWDRKDAIAQALADGARDTLESISW